jgi:hypothetical protein
MQRWSIGYGATLVLVLASCGAGSHAPSATTTPPPTRSPSAAATVEASPTSTPAAPGTLASCVGSPSASSSSAGPIIAVQIAASEVELVDTRGDVLNKTAIEPYSGLTPVGQGPDGIYLYTQSTGELQLLGLSGPLQTLAEVKPTTAFGDDFSLAASPNGQCWILSDTSYDSNLNGTSKLYVGFNGGGGPLLLTTLTRAASVNGSYGGGFRVLRWDASGALLGTDPTSVGGGGPFIGDGYILATVVSLNPLTGAVSSSLCTKGRFGDVAPDGTVACLTGSSSDAQITVTSPHGSTATIDTGMPFAGQIGFVEGSSLLTFCTSDDVETADGDWTTNLLVAKLNGQVPSPDTLSSGDGPGQNESSYAWSKLLDGTSIVETRGDSGSSSLVMIDLTTGQTTTIAPADSILGVL